MLQLYNTLSRKKETFKPLENDFVRMYNCGPTVYDLPHVGNYRSFFLADILRRYLEFRGNRVLQVLNITDIDDKTIRDSQTSGMNFKDFTTKYTSVFFDGLDKLRIRRAHIHPRATEHIEEMLELVQMLVEKGFAYEKEGNVYFSIVKFSDYGKLNRIDTEGMKPGSSVDLDEYEKDDVRDFVLWKASKPEEIEQGIFYDSPWGKGRPGWHIECSAMSMKYLGETLDIHTGGTDNAFPHHENEIAQSEAATGKPFVRFWVHGAHLIVDGEKMSKSKGNYFTLNDLLEKYDTDEIRYFFLSTHYRSLLNYTEKAIEGSRSNVSRLRNTLRDARSIIQKYSGTTPGVFGSLESNLLKTADSAEKNFIQSMDDDLNTPGAISSVINLQKVINAYVGQTGKEDKVNVGILQTAVDQMQKLLDVLGILPEDSRFGTVDEISSIMDVVIELRAKARKEKNYELSDNIRSELAKIGIELIDDQKGTRWAKKFK